MSDDKGGGGGGGQAIVGLLVVVMAGGALAWYFKGDEIRFRAQQWYHEWSIERQEGAGGAGGAAVDVDGVIWGRLNRDSMYRSEDVDRLLEACLMVSCSDGRPDPRGRAEIRRALARTGWYEAQHAGEVVWIHDEGPYSANRTQ